MPSTYKATMQEHHVAMVRRIRDQQLNAVSPTFCLAKWLQVTVHLATGKTHSCHHCPTHSVPLVELAADPGALHNTLQKEQERQAMLRGEQPGACNYCWNIENGQPDALSDRSFKSATPWAQESRDRVFAAIRSPNTAVYPSYLEVNVGTTCNMRCLYCSPEFSSKWAEDTKRHGGYFKTDGQALYDPVWMTANGYDPIPDPNPYEEAFHVWWPQVSPHLKVFRLTGGEPLLNKATWRVMEDLLEHPRPDLEFAVNTNLSVPDALIDKLVSLFQQLEGKVRKLTIFTSAEGMGQQQEFARDGMNWYAFSSNVHRILRQTSARVTFMTTINVFSYETFPFFMEWVASLRNTYDPDNYTDDGRVGLSLAYLRAPDFLSLRVLNTFHRKKFKMDCEAAAAKLGPAELLANERTHLGYILEWLVQGTSEEAGARVGNLKLFLQQVKARRGLDVAQAWPSLWDCVGADAAPPRPVWEGGTA